jgi:hypothetical protein
MRDRPEGDGFVFLGPRGRPWTRHHINVQVRRNRRESGLRSGAALYGLRHLFGLQALKRGVSIKLAGLLMGHNRVATTEHYVTHLVEKQTGRVRRFSSVAEAISPTITRSSWRLRNKRSAPTAAHRSLKPRKGAKYEFL